ncbi:hypothetical protein OHB04_05345 [Streptomyces sp. NBC_01775]|uniref:hypothetical protein n=1 Tax=Streptomyces sp. NBC_01775 TaxID=2975939 RepID=UPI002DDA2780|nr:hypothetical protein [Streptomyces sp. NBC_01775]WSB75259.1 hypothetical protein OHB04_05345 [Streptomyces sp. NBC_01775]
MEPELELRGHSWIIDRLVTVRSDEGQVLLVSADTHNSVRVWDPLTGELVGGPVQGDEVRTQLAALRLGPVELARASGRGVVPATERTRALIVDIGGERVQVIDPDTDLVVFEFAQPPDRRNTSARGFSGRPGCGWATTQRGSSPIGSAARSSCGCRRGPRGCRDGGGGAATA